MPPQGGGPCSVVAERPARGRVENLVPNRGRDGARSSRQRTGRAYSSTEIETRTGERIGFCTPERYGQNPLAMAAADSSS